MNERLTMTSDKGGLAFTFNLDVTCSRDEMLKIVALGERLKQYEDLCTPEELAALVEAQKDRPLTCDGCECRGEYENEVEYGYPSPCTACQRRAIDNYRHKPEAANER